MKKRAEKTSNNAIYWALGILVVIVLISLIFYLQNKGIQLNEPGLPPANPNVKPGECGINLGTPGPGNLLGKGDWLMTEIIKCLKTTEKYKDLSGNFGPLYNELIIEAGENFDAVKRMCESLNLPIVEGRKEKCEKMEYQVPTFSIGSYKTYVNCPPIKNVCIYKSSTPIGQVIKPSPSRIPSPQ